MIINRTIESYKQFLRDDLDEWTATSQWSYYNCFRDTYKHLVEKVVEDEDKGFEAAALTYFTSLCEATISAKEHLFTAMLDNMLRFLHHKECLAAITQQVGGDKALAWFVCYVSANCVQKTNYYSDADGYLQKNLIRLLENWSGRQVPIACRPTLDVVVTHIYGELCWEFLGCDLARLTNHGIRDMTLDQIMSADLPLTFREKIVNPGSAPTDLPPDLSY